MRICRNIQISSQIGQGGQHRVSVSSFVLHWHLLCSAALFVALLNIRAFLFMIETKNSPPSGSSHFMSMNEDASIMTEIVGDFCPESPCKIGETSMCEAFLKLPQAVNDAQSNPKNQFVTVNVKLPGSVKSTSFIMCIRDPKKDKFISGTIAAGRVHDEHIQKLVVKTLHKKTDSVFIDVGANIGYFTATALALGAKTISFEPFYDNAGALMSTIQRNGWENQSTLYLNALGYESNRVTMKPTNNDINLSNMHITGSTCVSDFPPYSGQIMKYGIDYMDTVSLDQVMQTNHPDIQRVHLMKIDVETREIEVFNGAIHTLCNVVVERIVVEVQYLKPHNSPTLIRCNFDKLQQTLVELGYEIYDVEEEVNFGGKKLLDFPADIVFKLKDTRLTPASRLRGEEEGKVNPCKKFDKQTRRRSHM